MPLPGASNDGNFQFVPREVSGGPLSFPANVFARFWLLLGKLRLDSNLRRQVVGTGLSSALNVLIVITLLRVCLSADVAVQEQCYVNYRR